MKIRVTSQFKIDGQSDLDQQTDELQDAISAIQKEHAFFSGAAVSNVADQRLLQLSIVVNAETWGEASDLVEDAIDEAFDKVGGHIRGTAGASNTSPSFEASIQGTELVPAT